MILYDNTNNFCTQKTMVAIHLSTYPIKSTRCLTPTWTLIFVHNRIKDIVAKFWTIWHILWEMWWHYRKWGAGSSLYFSQRVIEYILNCGTAISVLYGLVMSPRFTQSKLFWEKYHYNISSLLLSTEIQVRLRRNS